MTSARTARITTMADVSTEGEEFKGQGEAVTEELYWRRTMSDVLVKGMRMPKSCYSEVYSENGFCTFHFFDTHGKSHCSISACKCFKTRRPKGCPLVLVPEHGDLIDKQKLLDKVYDTYEGRVVYEEDIEEAEVVLEGTS